MTYKNDNPNGYYESVCISCKTGDKDPVTVDNFKIMQTSDCSSKVIPKPPDCNEAISGDKGSNYRGCQSKTRRGYTCQAWDD